MSGNKVLLPPALLNHWVGPKSDSSHGDASNNDGTESFDVTKVAAQAARQVRIEDHEPELATNTGTLGGRRRGQTISDREPVLWTPAASSRPRSVNLGDIGRSRVKGRQNSANPTIQPFSAGLSSIAEASIPSSKHNSSEEPKTVQGPAQLQTQEVLQSSNLEDTYVLQSLNDFTFSSVNGVQESQPVFFAEGYGLEDGPPAIERRNTVKSGNSDRSRFSTQKRRSTQNSARRPTLTRAESEVSGYSTQTIARRASVLVDRTVEGVQNVVSAVFNTNRKSSVAEMYEKAQVRQTKIKRSPFAQYAFEYIFYLLIVAIVYLVLVGVPLWKGVVWYIYIIFMQYLLIPAGTAIFLGIGFLYAYLPLLINFEKTAPTRERPTFPPHPGVTPTPRPLSENLDTALLIPCYKSESLIAATLEAALKLFPPENIFVIANGNSPTPLDDTASVCQQYGVSHTWSPLGSKIIAQFVGTYVAKRFPYVLLIDDDCLLPPNFPLVTERLRGKVQCIGYTIKSVGPNRSKGNLCQQAQDVEYKLSGIQRAFAGKLGSATFPHGAISIWDRELLIKTFQEHPGFSVSEDWFFGHVARQLGCRIQMCTSTFVETETPSAIFFSGGGARGGFGEMTIWKQRFFRWNFFFVNGMYYDMAYIIKDWRLGWWEIGAKIFVFQEVYETLLYLLAPFVLPISFIVRPAFSAYMFAATLALYFVNVIIFNYVHLRSRGEMVSVMCLLYYMPYKIILTFVNIASCYYSIYKYAKYFAKRHAKVVEDENAVAIVLKLEEDERKSTAGPGGDSDRDAKRRTRNYSITAVGTTLDSALNAGQVNPTIDLTEGVQITDFGAANDPRLYNSPEALSPESCQPPLSSSSRKSWRQSSPTLGRGRNSSYFPRLERNASSTSTFRRPASTISEMTVTIAEPKREAVFKDPSTNAPWPLREGSAALSPFSSAWPGPGSTFPAAQPAVSIRSAVPTRNRYSAGSTNASYTRPLSTRLSQNATRVFLRPASSSSGSSSSSWASRVANPNTVSVSSEYTVDVLATPARAHFPTNEGLPMGNVIVEDPADDGEANGATTETAESWDRRRRRISPRFRFSVVPRRPSLPEINHASRNNSVGAGDGTANV